MSDTYKGKASMSKEETIKAWKLEHINRLTRVSVAFKMGVNDDKTISRMYKHYGLPSPKRGKKQKGIDTVRLRILQTNCMTVDEIAEAMGITSSEVERELEDMGYKPIYEKDVPEPSGFVSKLKKGKK